MKRAHEVDRPGKEEETKDEKGEAPFCEEAADSAKKQKTDTPKLLADVAPSYPHRRFTFFYSHRPSKGQKAVGRECCSQWYLAPCVVDGAAYNCCEQAMMSAKAGSFGETAEHRKHNAQLKLQIMRSKAPKVHKACGRKVAGFSMARWRTLREDVIFRANWAKFSQNPALKKWLLATGDSILVEASSTDAVYGIGLSATAAAKMEPGKWPGINLLGRTIMLVRERLRADALAGGAVATPNLFNVGALSRSSPAPSSALSSASSTVSSPASASTLSFSPASSSSSSASSASASSSSSTSASASSSSSSCA